MRLRELLLLNTSQAKDEEEKNSMKSRNTNIFPAGEITTSMATSSPAGSSGGSRAVNAGGIRGRGGGVFDGDSAVDDDEDGDDDDDDSGRKETRHETPFPRRET